ncbi:MAG: hypothetical protein ACTTI3_09500, partial [Treponema sp.]
PASGCKVYIGKKLIKAKIVVKLIETAQTEVFTAPDALKTANLKVKIPTDNVITGNTVKDKEFETEGPYLTMELFKEAAKKVITAIGGGDENTGKGKIGAANDQHGFFKTPAPSQDASKEYISDLANGTGYTVDDAVDGVLTVYIGKFSN